MSQIESIRQMAELGKSVREICREQHADYRTVRKYLNRTDFSEELPVKVRGKSKLDAYSAEIGGLLEANSRNWYKQRMTAKRVWSLMRERHPEFNASYSAVQRHVKAWKKKNRDENSAGFSRLVWHGGESQADFGEADFIRDGRTVRYKYFILSFPAANIAFCQIYEGENCECVCQALADIFMLIGCVPAVIVFDNATGIGRRMCSRLIENELFVRFRLHYRFTARFCNPHAGHEKGNVETNVGYIRRNLFVPPMELPDDIEKFNRTVLPEKCEALMADRMHYLKKRPVAELFKEGRNSMLPLPDVQFKARRILTLKTNGYAEVTLDGCHRYTIDPAYRNTAVIVETWAWKVAIYTSEGALIEEFRRRYGGTADGSAGIRTCINSVMRKPGSWSNSELRNRMDACDPFVKYMDAAGDSREKRLVLRRFSEAADTYSFETASRAFSEMANRRADMTKAGNVAACCRRTQAGTLNASSNSTGVDLGKYTVLTEGVKEEDRAH